MPAPAVAAAVANLVLLPAQAILPGAPTWEMATLAAAVATLFWAMIRAKDAHLTAEQASRTEWRESAKTSAADTAKTTDVLRSVAEAMERQRTEVAADLKTVREETTRRFDRIEAALARIEDGRGR